MNTNSIFNRPTFRQHTTNKTQIPSYFEYLVEGLFLICWELPDTRCPLAPVLHNLRMPILIFVQVSVIIMTLYVKGFKVGREKVAKIVEARDGMVPRVETGIAVIMDLINRSAYVAGGYEPPNPKGCDILALILGLELGYDEDELKGKHLGEIDGSIQKALPHALVGPEVWEVWE